MLPSRNAIHLVTESEGVRLTAYQDSGGVWTIGYGHTANVQEGQAITQAQAEDLLMRDMAAAAAAVNGLVTVPLNQNQFDALTDFVFNVGYGAFERSTLLRLLNQRNYQAAAGQFPVWCLDNGQVMPGLVTRRAAERALFEAV